MPEATSTAILKEYDESKGELEKFRDELANFVKKILDDDEIKYHSVDGRVKDRDSLHTKIQDPSGKYRRLSDVTDVVGLRITTFFEDEVKEVSKLIADEFTVDVANSEDKKALLDPDRFGYLSHHHIVSLTDKRLELREYKRFGHRQAEIQVRSILQHAWAEIEHDLGYKSKHAIPNLIKRRFCRLAGLFELADQEFMSIRDDKLAYERQLSIIIDEAPESVPIDYSSLSNFIANNEVINDLDARLKSLLQCAELRPATQSKTNDRIAMLSEFGISSIRDLEARIRKEERAIYDFASYWVDGQRFDYTERGISLFYLGYLLIGRKDNADIIREYFRKFEIGPQEDSELEANVQKVLDVSHRIIQ